MKISEAIWIVFLKIRKIKWLKITKEGFKSLKKEKLKNLTKCKLNSFNKSKIWSGYLKMSVPTLMETLKLRDKKCKQKSIHWKFNLLKGQNN